MGAPPQARPNAAQHAERDAKIYRLRMHGLTVREIAAQVDLGPTRVHEIITEEIAAHIGPVAEEYADHREAELADYQRRANAIYTMAADADTKLKAIDRLVKINAERRKLRGADAPEAMEVALSRRLDADAEITAQAITTALERLSLPPDRIAYALEVAGAVLEGGEVPAPVSSGLGAAPYVDNGAQYVDGPPGSGLRYRVVATERQPGERADVPALMPARAADPDDATDLLDVIDAEIADLEED
ncbi:hypothetical protein [Streptomyces spinosisporus]|jgi:hypothetical protein|uniref:Helix-turn-helix domain-containing protein n=1 Tax=Streptomyces spinosisporus TaxID=2927582 RepID=A0ABS9X829_9ACTN|nr:hypothetical protein [Streptomyces spinosisporus]MCI3238216.1 hypothetical protein [Streptomyces spinosisporus]